MGRIGQNAGINGCPNAERVADDKGSEVGDIWRASRLAQAYYQAVLGRDREYSRKRDGKPV